MAGRILFSFGGAMSPNGFFHQFEHIRRIIVRTARPAHTRRNLFDQNMVPFDLAMTRYALLNERAATILAGFSIPEAHCLFSFGHAGLSS